MRAATVGFAGLVATATSSLAFRPPSHHAPSSSRRRLTTKTSLPSSSSSSSASAPPPSTSTRRRRSDLPPPPCPRSNPSDDLFRTVRTSWPVQFQNFLRESGVLRTVEDALILLAVPELMQQHPTALETFLDLSKRTSRISYGDHGMQYVELIEPSGSDAGRQADGVVAFVHGGAWGSGQPWMYRLAALPFLEANKAVAIVGYRTFPDATVDGQVEDIGAALDALARERPDLLDAEGRINSLVCHSSGAHIGLLHVLEAGKASLGMTRNGYDATTKSAPTPIRQFVGLSGVYCIATHYDYEAGRGVEQLSGLRAANGPGMEGFRDASPAYRLECVVGADGDEECVLLDEAEGGGGAQVQVRLDEHVPDLLFVHGIEDNVVQYNQTNVVVDALRSSLDDPDRCQEILLEEVGHADTVLHLMFGGVTREVVVVGGQVVNGE